MSIPKVGQVYTFLKTQNLIVVHVLYHLLSSISLLNWFSQQNQFTTNIEGMEKKELNKCLRKFYVSARNQDGRYYNKSIQGHVTYSFAKILFGF